MSGAVVVLVIGALLIYAGVTGRIEAVWRALKSPEEDR